MWLQLNNKPLTNHHLQTAAQLMKALGLNIDNSIIAEANTTPADREATAIICNTALAYVDPTFAVIDDELSIPPLLAKCLFELSRNDFKLIQCKTALQTIGIPCERIEFVNNPENLFDEFVQEVKYISCKRSNKLKNSFEHNKAIWINFYEKKSHVAWNNLVNARCYHLNNTSYPIKISQKTLDTDEQSLMKHFAEILKKENEKVSQMERLPKDLYIDFVAFFTTIQSSLQYPKIAKQLVRLNYSTLTDTQKKMVDTALDTFFASKPTKLFSKRPFYHIFLKNPLTTMAIVSIGVGMLTHLLLKLFVSKMNHKKV